MRRSVVIAPAAAVLVLLAPPLAPSGSVFAQEAGQPAEPGQRRDVRQPIDAGRAVAADASIKIWNGAGTVRIEGWEADSIHVTGDAPAGAFFLYSGGTAAKLGLEGSEEGMTAQMVIRLPEAATVWVRTGAADVTVRGVTGSLDVHSVIGSIDVEGRLANLYAESMGGDVRLDIDSDIARAQSGTGRITLTGTVSDLTLSTVSGLLDVEVPELRRGRMTTVEGDIRFTGAVQGVGSLALETHSGDVSLHLPSDLDADYELSTFEGGIQAPLADRRASDVVGRDDSDATGEAGAGAAGTGRKLLRFQTGAGGAEVTARSYSGSISVEDR